MSILSQLSCSPCREGEGPITDEEIAVLHPLVPAWKIVTEGDHRKLRHDFPFADGKTMRTFLRCLEEMALKEKHQPEIDCHDKTVTVTLWTPEVDGLHPNDFILAAKADGAFTFALVGAEGTMFTDEPLPRLEDLPRFRKIAARRAAG